MRKGEIETNIARPMNVFVMILAIFLIIGGYSIVSVSDGVASRSGDELPTREEEIVPDFDIQYMIEPDIDPLSPLYNEKWSKIPPGASVEIWVVVMNMGEKNDTYEILLSGPSADTGWEYYFKEEGGTGSTVNLTSPRIRDEFGGISFKTFIVEVQCPIDGGKGWNIPLEVSMVSENSRSAYGPDGLSDTDRLFFIVGEISYLHISPPWKRIYYTDPGEWIDITVPFTNLGNKDEITIDIIIEEGDHWRTSYRDFENIYTRSKHLLDLEWTRSVIDVHQGETVFKNISVRTPPLWAGEDDVFQFRIFAYIVGAPLFYMSDIVTIIVNKLTKLQVEIEDIHGILMKQGSFTTVDLNINNTYYSEDIIRDIYLLETAGFYIDVFDDHLLPLNRIAIPERSSVKFHLNISMDNFLEPGEYRRTLIIDALFFGKICMNITIVVPEKNLLRMLPTDPIVNERIEIGPGGEKKIVLGLRNEGNIIDTFSIEMLRSLGKRELGNTTPIENGWKCDNEWISQAMEPPNFLELDHIKGPVNTSRFDRDVGYILPLEPKQNDMQYSIAPGETLWFGFSISAPARSETEIVEPYPVKFVVENGEKGYITVIDRVLEVRYPDLEFKGMPVLRSKDGDLINSASPGEKVFFEVNISNEGEWYSERALVRIYDGEKSILDIRIKPLAPGDRVVLKGNFTVSSGTDAIQFEIDPGNDIVESNDQFMEGSGKYANRIEFPLIVQPEIDEKPSLGWWFMFFSLILIILILLTMCGGALYIRKRDGR